jgi:sec-independent protein translocase protein TatA
MVSLFAFQPSMIHLLIILAIGVLFFGRRLPEIGRSLGKSITEFQKGMKGIEDDLNPSSGPAPRADAAPSEAIRPPQRVSAPNAPHFENTNPRPEDHNAPPVPPRI